MVSISRNGTISTAVAHRVHFQLFQMTTMAIKVVTTMVPLTATP